MTKLKPSDGGCWFCSTDDEGEWLFSSEYDTNLHIECLEKALDEGDELAIIMGREFI